MRRTQMLNKLGFKKNFLNKAKKYLSKKEMKVFEDSFPKTKQEYLAKNKASAEAISDEKGVQFIHDWIFTGKPMPQA